MKSIALFSSLVVLIVAQQDGQQWGINFAPSNGDSNGLNGFFSGITGFFEDLGNAITFGGPSFLRNVTRQGRQDYYKIMQNKTLTRAQIQTAVGNWADANNVTSQVNAYNSKKQTEKNQFRSNVTSAVQQLPNLISQLNAIDDNQSLTPSQAADQTRQTIRNATQPFLRDLVFDVLPPSSIGSAIGGAFDAMGDDNNNSSEEDGDIFSRK
ncbi:hypothetical protein PRIPAC_81156 [Pristionchus pacificus]|uniref:DUF148 domain-containing protein n=1 Tax=Pristionchus pacificus TaxID=54126 RepID=A0A454Y0X6_PRIPA|nr:hypothetical protein PRIPAC_81156 [Pristionchus pacificus]|eukprot:PDM72511.1 hypothetical protein PRIPAC_38945 [Pristionchus pacificus]